MSTLIVSDLHVGDNKSGHLDLYNFLQASPDVDELIIAGDLFDFWVTSVGRALKEGNYLLDYIYYRFGKKAIYLTGNHDEDLQYVDSINGIKIKQFHRIEIAGKKIMVCHGHQYDTGVYINQAEWLARINAWLVNKADKWFNIDTRKWLVSLSDRVDGDPYDKLIFTYELNLKREFENLFDVIITGHTHLPLIKTMGNLVYVNTGDWMQNRTALLIEEEDSSISLLDYSDGEIHLVEVINL